MATAAGRQWGEAAGGEQEGGTRRRAQGLEEFLGETAVRFFQTGVEEPGEATEAHEEEGRNTAALGSVTRGGRGLPVVTWNVGEGDPWWSSSTGWWQGGWGWRSDRWSSDWWSSDRGKDYSDPPAWAGWSNYRLWRKAVVRWDQATDVQPRRRAERIFKTMDWELQAKFEHIEDVEITGEEYLKHILSILDTLAGESAAVDKRRAVRKALFEGQRKEGETINQFTLRREQEFAMAEKYMPLPGDLKALMLEEQASLGKQGTMNLRTLTSGSNKYEDVVKALKVLDLDEEGFTANKGKPAGFVGHAHRDSGMAPAEDSGEEEIESLGSEDVQDILAEVEKLDLAEEEAMEVFLALEKEKKSWKENRKLKMARKRDRRHFAGKPAGIERRPRLSTEQLKRVSRCSNCGEKGHWAEDCSRPYRSKADRLAQEAKKKGDKGGAGGQKGAAFVFLGGETKSFAASSFSGMAIPLRVQEVLDKFKKGEEDDKSFLTLAPGVAIIDPGAGQDLIGQEAYRRLEEELARGGLRAVKLEEKPAPASGVGGRAKTMFTALVPCILGGAAGVVKVTVVEEDIPHLLSIGLLESAGAVINTASNVIEFRNIGTEDSMTRIKSGHRVLNIAKWSGEQFPVPEEVKEQYGLQAGAFNLLSESCEVYMSGRPDRERDHWKSVEGTPLLLRVHQEYRDHLFQPDSNDPGCSLMDMRVSVKCMEAPTLSMPQQERRVRIEETELPTPLEHPQSRTVIVGPVPDTGRQPPTPRSDSRRGSVGTISEPASEPRNPQEEEAEVKRRRTLPPVPEEGTGAGASSSSSIPIPQLRPVPSRPARESPVQEPLEEATVSERVREIEGRGRGEEEEQPRRRRSRSPLPSVLRFRTPTPVVRPGPTQAEETVLWTTGDAQYREGTKEEIQRYKKALRKFYHGTAEEAEDEEGMCLLNLSTQSGNWAVEVPRNGEITWKEMTEEEFQKSDLTEWESLEKEFKAVKVWTGEAAEKLRRSHPDRIMTARVVRRKKPMPGLHQFKAKSRFCVHGHKDPDGGTFRTFAPTPTTEALHMVCQIIANYNMRLLFADVKAAFAQANKLVRPRGRLFVEPCDGTPLRKKDLIELIAPVYGLDDAPLRWFETISSQWDSEDHCWIHASSPSTRNRNYSTWC